MKKIDFQHFRLSVGVANTNFTQTDVREGFADIIYKNASGIAALELARKIYTSEGETEFDDKEVKLIDAVVEQLTTPAFIVSYHKIFDEQKQ